MVTCRNFQKELGTIYRLKVPFESVYTSVFLIKTLEGNILVECATTKSDVDEWIAPALETIGLSFLDINYLVLTHCHSDHAGGKEFVLQHNPKIKCLQKEESKLTNNVTTYAIKGHTFDFIGVFDGATGTLISGDGLQGAGIGKYRCSLESKEEYLKAIEKIRLDKKIKNILFSHAYEPWYKDGMFGRENVERCLQDCIKYIKGE